MFFFATFFFFSRFLRTASIIDSLITGVFCGIALLSKFTSAILPLILIALMLFYFLSREYKNGGKSAARYLSGLLFSLFIAVIVLNAGYCFDKTLMPLSAFQWNSGQLNALKDSFIGSIPLPLPYLYIDAFDQQLFKSGSRVFDYYLNGNISRSGWASYYWIAIALKTPIPLIIFGLAGFLTMFRKKVSFHERSIWLIPFVFLIMFSTVVKIDFGIRYLLPILPFVIVAASGVMSKLLNGNKAGNIIVALFLACSILSPLKTFGNGLAYFNEFAGGPSGGHRYLVESNLDWGQNLARLKKYTDTNETSPLLVYNYGLVPASAYGIKNAGWVPCEPARAVVAISVNYLYGIDPFQHRSRECFSWLADKEPIKKLGYGLFIFDTRDDPDLNTAQ